MMLEGYKNEIAKQIAKDADDIILEVLGVPKHEALAIAQDRMSVVVIGGLRTFMLDGRPLVTFWPVDISRDLDPYRITASQRYEVHSRD